MAHVYKIIGKIYTTGVTGTNHTLKSEYEFISQPFTDLKECYNQMQLKGNEYIQNEPHVVAEIRLHGRYLSSNGNNAFKWVSRSAAIGTAPDDQYSEERGQLQKTLFSSFNW